jgi:peptidyl-prolyl cis-trans isomerase SurA
LRLIHKTTFAIILLCINLSAWAQPTLIDGVLAVVGKEIVLKSDLDQTTDAQLRQNPDLKIDNCVIFEDLLLEKLLLHQAELDSVVVGEDEVQSNIDRRIQVFIQQIGSQQKLEQYYGQSVLEIKDEMAPLIRNQLTAQRMLGEINGTMEITPSEVREFYNKIPTDSLPLINAELEYSEIVIFPTISNAAKQEAIDKLKEIKDRIENGSSFSTMAVLYSEDPGSARNGGEYKGIKRGQFVKEFEAVAFNLGLNEISDPFETEYGYHVVQVQRKIGQELDLRHVLIKAKITAANLESTKVKADSIRTLILDGTLSFGEAAEEFSDDEDSKLNAGRVMNPQTGDSRWEAGQLDKTVFYSLDNIEEGTISTPVFFKNREEEEGYKLIKLIDRSEAHAANLAIDYQRIKQLALSKKKQLKLEDWVTDKIKVTYVRVNNEYLQCDFQRQWINKTTYAE